MLNLTSADARVIESVHKDINKMPYVSDPAQYGVRDFWPDDLREMQVGDCEDYALIKRDMLHALFPRNKDAFLLAICRVEGPNSEPGLGGGHGVLLVHTHKGWFVLDNREEEMVAYGSQPYRYYAREPNYSERRIHKGAWIKIKN